MTVTQLDLLGVTVADPARDAVLLLIAGDPIHARDREAIVDAIRSSARADGTTTANAWRPEIPPWVYRRVIGAVVRVLILSGVLVPTGQWVVNDDTHGRNAGKPQMTYRWVDPAVRP